MKISLLFTGKTEAPWLKEGIQVYSKRLMRYIPFELIECPIPKKWASLPPQQRMEKEGQLQLERMRQHDLCILLDEKGTAWDSEGLARFLEERMNRSTKSLLMVVGGPWGFSPEVRKAAHMKWSLSPMTFSHQMIRLFLVEQLYRAFAIIRNEPYHNP